MKIAIIGAGYVGLVSGACLAEFGFDVACIDSDGDRIAALNRGEIPIHEPRLDDLIRTNARAGRLTFSAKLARAVAGAAVVMIAVGTPARRGDDAADLAYVGAAADEIAAAIRGYTVVVTKSTVPVGTARMLEAQIRARRPDVEFDMASNPEFLREGSAVDDFLTPDRVVVGAESDRARDVMRRLYRPLTVTGVPLLLTGFESAELIKYAANGYLAMRLAFVNELADLCEAVGADIGVVARGMGQDRRIGTHYLQPGPGYGGSCFPKDTRALAAAAREAASPMTLIEAVSLANDARKAGLAQRIVKAAGGSVSGKIVALLGVAFKAGTDDVRDSAALTLAPALHTLGAAVVAFDPAARKTGAGELPGIAWAADPYEAVRGADVVAVLTEWQAFRGLDLNRMAASMRTPVLVDFRNLYSRFDVAQTPFRYVSLGRPAVEP